MILIINGSPNKDSKTMKVSNELFKDSKQEIVIRNPYQMDFSSCDDCKYCEKLIGCSKKDDMTEIYTLLKEANTLVISSPIYFGALSDKTMKLINRFQRYYGQKWVLNDSNIPTFKNLILVSTQGSVKTRMFNGAKETMNILQKLFTPESYIEVLIPDSEQLPLMTKIDVDNIANKKKMIF